LLEKVFVVLKTLAKTMQIIVTIQTNQCQGYVKKMAKPCNCWTAVFENDADATDGSVILPDCMENTPEMIVTSIDSSGSATPTTPSNPRNKGLKQRTISLDTIMEGE
jgi:hypothetical protein